MEQKLVSLHVNNFIVIKCWVLGLFPYHYEGSMIIILAVNKIVWKSLSSVIMLECSFSTFSFMLKTQTAVLFIFFSLQIMYLVNFLIADSFRKKLLAELISQIKLSDIRLLQFAVLDEQYVVHSCLLNSFVPAVLLACTKYPHIPFFKKNGNPL